MQDVIKWLNPAAAIGSQPQALSAARASAVSLFLGAVWAVFTAVWTMTAGKAAMDAAMAQAAADAPEAAGFMGAMAGFTIGWAFFTALFQAVIGFVQWRWPNIVIPIIFAILVVFGLGSSVLGLMALSASPELAEAAAATPMWLTALSLLILAIQLLWHISGARGASALSRFKTEPQTANY